MFKCCLLWCTVYNSQKYLCPFLAHSCKIILKLVITHPFLTEFYWTWKIAFSQSDYSSRSFLRWKKEIVLCVRRFESIFNVQDRWSGQKGKKFALFSWSGCVVKKVVGAQFFPSGEISWLPADWNGNSTFPSCTFCSLFGRVLQDVLIHRYGFRKYGKHNPTIS